MSEKKYLSAPIIAIASGKGGAGKTSFTLNFANMLTKRGKRVLIFDADIGLANLDVQLGLSPSKDLSDVISGHCDLQDIIVRSERGFYILPGRSGFEKVPFLSTLERRNIFNKLRELAGSFDYVLLDIAAGVDEEVLGFCSFADRTFMVITPDPSSITDAYAVIKLLKIHHDCTNAEAIINQAGSTEEGRYTYEKISTAAERFLQVKLPLLGIVPYDRQYSAAVKRQQLTTVAFPNCPASEAIEKIALKVATS